MAFTESRTMACTRARFLIALASLSPMAAPPGARAEAADGKNLPTKAVPCMECLRVRLGVPYVARGPAPNTVDNSFSVIRLPNGRFRGFTAAGSSYAIDGDQPWQMDGPAVTVLKPGPPGGPSACGQWLIHVEPAGKTLLGWISNETACDYAKGGQTHSYMSIATSADYGLTWKILGAIIRQARRQADAGNDDGRGLRRRHRWQGRLLLHLLRAQPRSPAVRSARTRRQSRPRPLAEIFQRRLEPAGRRRRCQPGRRHRRQRLLLVDGRRDRQHRLGPGRHGASLSPMTA
jgi:hypothetical protein